MSWRISLVSGFLVAFGLASSTQAAEIHVPHDRPTIQAGIAASSNGDTVIVAPGRYVENIDFLGKAITVRSTNPDDPSVVSATIIDGGRKKHCVLFGTGETGASVIAGFTITNGKPTESSGHVMGGGISCWGSSPTIMKNRITGNSATAGSGIYCERSHATIVDNEISDGQGSAVGLSSSDTLFSRNRVLRNSGDAIYAIDWRADRSLKPVIEGNEIADNGGRAYSGTPYLYAALIGNLIRGNADGMYNCWGPVIDNMIIGNGCGRGIITVGQSEYPIAGNTIVGNNGLSVLSTDHGATILRNTIAFNKGGTAAVYCWDGRAVVSGNLIVGNDLSGWEFGSAIFVSSPHGTTIAGNTVVANISGSSGAAISCYWSDARARLMNNIIYGNLGPSGAQLASRADLGFLILSFCTVQGGKAAVFALEPDTVIWGPGNIDADPRFVDPGHWDDNGTPADPADDKFITGDYHLLPGSPCIDAGTNDVDDPDTPEVETLPATDFAGIRRVIDGNLDGTATVDMGAYEYLPGDVNYDGKVNVLDLLNVRNSMGRDPASSPAARKADLNADGRVDVPDLIAARNALQR